MEVDLLEQILERSAIGIAILSSDDRWLYANGRFAGIVGYPSDQLARKSRAEVTHSDDFVHTSEELASVRSGAVQSTRFEQRLVTSAGRAVWTEATVVSLTGPGLEPGTVLVFVRKVTSRRESDRGFNVQHLVSRILASSASFDEAIGRILAEVGTQLHWDVGAYFELDSEKRTLVPASTWRAASHPQTAFEEATKKVSFERGVGVPGMVWERNAPVWETDALETPNSPRFEAANAEGFHAVFAFPVRTANEFHGMVEFFSTDLMPPDETLLNAAEGIGYQVGQFLERQRAQEAGHASEVRKASILDTALDCIITMDGGGKITEFNPAAEKTFGYSKTDVLGKEMSELIVPPALREAHRIGLRRYLATGEAHVLGRRIEITGMRSDGSEFPVELAIVKVPLPGPVFFTAYLRDLTERNQLARNQAEAHEQLEASNEELAAMNAELQKKTDQVVAALAAAEQANRAKSDFLATMSHELRTPLNAIGGYAELIQLGIRGPVTKQQKADLARIRRSQNQLLTLINDILKFAKLQSGTLAFQMHEFPVEEVLCNSEDLVRPQIGAKNIGYTYEGGDPRVTVCADPDRFQQVILNLLSNAVKFTPASGKIRLSWKALEKQVAISISDTGIGIPPDKLMRVFDPFVQVNAPFAKTTEGVGLGLAISRDIADRMKGSLTVESEVGKGSVFTVTLRRGADLPKK